MPSRVPGRALGPSGLATHRHLRRPPLTPPADLAFAVACSKRVEGQLTDLEAKLEAKKMELVHLQTQMQQKAEQEAQESAPPAASQIATAAV